MGCGLPLGVFGLSLPRMPVDVDHGTFVESRPNFDYLPPGVSGGMFVSSAISSAELNASLLQ